MMKIIQYVNGRNTDSGYRCTAEKVFSDTFGLDGTRNKSPQQCYKKATTTKDEQRVCERHATA